MKIEYRGMQKTNSFGEKLARPLTPCAVVSFHESESEIAMAIIEGSGYEYDVFGDGDECWANVPVDDRADYNEFKQMWKEGKKAYNVI